MSHMVKESGREMLGRVIGLRSRQVYHGMCRRLNRPPSSRAGISRLTAHCTDIVGSGDAPIFVLGAGPASGAAPMQRMLNATPGTLVWGEPSRGAGVVQPLCESLAFLDPQRGRFHGRVLPDEADLPYEDEWTANLTPPLDHLVEAHRTLLDRMFKVPATERGCARWGSTEIVTGRDAVDLLSMLYPNARFVLMVRDPVIQWSARWSIKGRAGLRSALEQSIDAPLGFGRMWDRVVREFVAAAEENERVTVVRFEDLTTPGELTRLTAFLELDALVQPEAALYGSPHEQADSGDSWTRWAPVVVRRCTSGSRGRIGYG